MSYWLSQYMKPYVVNGVRLIKEFDREIKDGGARNPEEVNKQLNDEKQSMVSTKYPRTLTFSCLCWKPSIYLFKVWKGFKNQDRPRAVNWHSNFTCFYV